MIFLHENKYQSCMQDGSVVFTGHTKHAQSTQNSKLVFCNISKRDKVNFLHGDKHQTILHVDTINLGGLGLACPNYKNNTFAKSVVFQERSEGEVDFCAMRITVFYKLIL